MALNISGGLFKQTDVRETETTTTPGSDISYFSIPGGNFIANNPDTDAMHYASLGTEAISDTSTLTFNAPVKLPHGAVITGAIVYSSESDLTWTLNRAQLTVVSSEDIMATSTTNTEDITISNATVNNASYCYTFTVLSVDTTDSIIGARITYTT